MNAQLEEFLLYDLNDERRKLFAEAKLVMITLIWWTQFLKSVYELVRRPEDMKLP